MSTVLSIVALLKPQIVMKDVEVRLNKSQHTQPREELRETAASQS
jgi:hypothetical protein